MTASGVESETNLTGNTGFQFLNLKYIWNHSDGQCSRSAGSQKLLKLLKTVSKYVYCGSKQASKRL